MTDSLIGNAILSISMGVKDLHSGQYARSLSAIRNIYAGILLLCKEVLVRHSPKNSNDVLIKSRILPSKGDDGTIIFVGKGRKTVNRTQIQERFESLGLSLDWNRLNRISEIRNEIEHFYSKKPEPLLREALSGTFVLVHRLVVDHLNELPIALLGQKTWQALLEANEVYEKEHARCISSFGSVSFGSPILEQAIEQLSCPSCGSSLIMQLDEGNADEYSIELLCSSCGAIHERETIFEAALINEKYHEYYLSYNDTGDWALEPCPGCRRQSYIVEENKCALCGYNPVDITDENW